MCLLLWPAAPAVARLSAADAAQGPPNGPYCGPIRVVSRPETGRLVVQDGPFGARPLPP